MALDRQKEAAEKKSMIQQQQQKQAEGLVPRMKVSPSSTDVFNLPDSYKATTRLLQGFDACLPPFVRWRALGLALSSMNKH